MPVFSIRSSASVPCIPIIRLVLLCSYGPQEPSMIMVRQSQLMIVSVALLCFCGSWEPSMLIVRQGRMPVARLMLL